LRISIEKQRYGISYRDWRRLFSVSVDAVDAEIQLQAIFANQQILLKIFKI
jgi:hypothetical protein